MLPASPGKGQAKRPRSFASLLAASIEASPSPEHYRNSVTLHETVKNSPHSQVFGFFAKNNRTVIPIESCLLLSEKLQEVLGRKILLKKGEKDIQYKLAESGEIYSDRKDHLFPVTIGEDSVLAHSQGFFQNNLAVTALIASQIKSWIQEVSPQSFTDLFCGTGTFTLLSAAGVPELICAEENEFALEALAENLKERDLKAEVLKGPAEKIFINFCKKHTFNDAMLMLDPPRQGLRPELAEFLASEARFEEVVYLSCHMGTLIRDIQILIGAGHYRVDTAIPFDMFPRTKHIEVLVRLKKTA